MIAEPPSGTQPVYLVYADGGARLVYSGGDRDAALQTCTELAARNEGYLSGYLFMGRRRVEFRVFFPRYPGDAFIAARAGRDLFDVAWHRCEENGGKRR